MFDTDMDYYGNEPKPEVRRVPYEYMRIIYIPDPITPEQDEQYDDFIPGLYNTPADRPHVVN